jgi:hypothetical protein
MLTDKQKKETLDELFDDQKVNRVRFFCSKHGYSGPVKERPEITPGLACANCWKVFYFHEIATTPPDERGQKLEEIEEVMRNMVSMVEKGTWDFEPYDHAQVEIGEE